MRRVVQIMVLCGLLLAMGGYGWAQQIPGFPVTYEVRIEIEGEGLVSVDPAPYFPDESAFTETTTLTYLDPNGDGIDVALSADPAEGLILAGWELIDPEGVTLHTTTDLETVLELRPGWSSPSLWTVRATFAPPYTLTVDAEGQGEVEVDGEPVGLPYEHHYTEGEELALEAVPEEGWVFSHWEGPVADPDEATTTVTMDEDKAVTAHFLEGVWHTLTLDAQGEGEVEIDEVPVDLPFEEDFAEGAEVEVSAVPEEGWVFSHWEGPVADPNSATTTVTMDEDKAVTAHFLEDGYTLTVNIEGGGTVTQDPDRELYEHGTVVSLQAEADEGWEFIGWSGDTESIADTASPDTEIEMVDDYAIIAEFSALWHTIVATSGEGGTISPQGEIAVDPGDDQTFVITPDPGYIIDVVWVNGKSAGAVGEYTFTDVASDQIIHALFRTSTASKHFEAGWRLLSVPSVPAYKTPASVFKSVTAAGQPLVIYEWVPENSYDEPSSIDPGRGYWMYLDGAVKIEVSGALPTGDYEVVLGAAGWHLVSAPRWPVPWASTKFTRDGDNTTKTLAEAVSAGWVEPYAFSYSTDEGEYVAVKLPDPGASLDSWKGYWLKTLVDDLTMTIPLDGPWASGTPAAQLSLAEVPADLRPPAPPGGARPGAGPLTATVYPNPVAAGEATFRVTGGLPVAELRVTVLDLSGCKVWQAESTGNQLTWNLTDSAGRTVANGVYLYRVQANVGDRWLPAGYGRLLIGR